jgi:hypothetical protein
MLNEKALKLLLTATKWILKRLIALDPNEASIFAKADSCLDLRRNIEAYK